MIFPAITCTNTFLKRSIAVFLLSVAALSTQAQTKPWSIVKGKLTTPWTAKVNPQMPLPEYPRPQMVRGNWQNLNGLWNYAITAVKDKQPAKFAGKILVPYPVESSLSGVGRTVDKDSTLWYSNTISINSALRGKTVLLHFGAVDWQTEVFVNGKSVGIHEGGYDPFTFDITPYLVSGAKQDIKIRVWDPTDDGPQPRGKQVKKPEGIWYTQVTGIWQTVWLEGVPQSYIKSTKQTPDVENQTLTISGEAVNAQKGDKLRVIAMDGSEKIAEKEIAANDTAKLKIKNAKLWSPENPYLYNLQIALVRNNKVLDEVKSYFAMRKISIGPDANGIQRMMLNNQFVFQFGPLDQGWWPDGLYTPPTYEAMQYDVDQLKAMGFNMIRKHVKVEPARFYAYCDKTGMLLWQDMPSGDLGNNWENRPGVYQRATDKNRTAASELYYRKEWNAIIDALYNFPSIVVWTPFNEAWGQFKTEEITKWTMQKDPSRLVNSASGGNYYSVGHMIDLHNYPDPAMPRAEIFGKTRALVLGEFGGLGLGLEGHTWQDRHQWGYQNFKDADAVFKKYSSFIEPLKTMIRLGLSAAVYTQTTDVEGEVNGFMTYDRKVIKMPVEKLHSVNTQLYDTSLVK
ncbi:beta-galactosidase [Mucilaginibacter sp. RS28]|uniref:Beta-galactosidase n=1 Tax=Mucilaginibacter straminoryzae TaxID=2932774 RepID=A0A9X2BAC6_9SPHI|nr:sugar-binding domain-containing protein [Mucilaginibacter straminoryzae]MCJ8208637.1 beta-galactosidase [Mucilaginibacter straminoryzae]